MRTCGILSALLLAIIAIPALAVSILYNGVAQTVLMSPSFVASLDPKSMQARYQSVAPYLMQDALTEADGPDSLLTGLFPDPTTRATARQILSVALANTSPTTLPQTIDANLTTAIVQILSAAPPCTPAAEVAILDALSRNQLPTFDCAPRTATIQQQIATESSQILQQSLTQVTKVHPIFRYTPQDVTNRITEIRAGAGQSLILPATLIVMMVALAVRSRRQLFGWLSGVFIAAAIVGLLLTFASMTLITNQLELFITQQLPAQAGLLLPLVSLANDQSFPEFIAWSNRAFVIMLGIGVIGSVISFASPKPFATKPRMSQPLGPQMSSIGDGSTNRVKTDYETDALFADPRNTHQLPPGLDTSKLTFERRLPKIPQPTQQITDMIPAGDHTSPLPLDNQTETLEHRTETQELGPKDDSQTTQRTDEHRF